MRREVENSASPYGTFDQGGNVGEWTETLDGDRRVVRGGDFRKLAFEMHAAYRDSAAPTAMAHGFRLAKVRALFENGDLNCDGAVNAFDIDPFVELLT